MNGSVIFGEVTNFGGSLNAKLGFPQTDRATLPSANSCELAIISNKVWAIAIKFRTLPCLPARSGGVLGSSFPYPVHLCLKSLFAGDGVRRLNGTITMGCAKSTNPPCLSIA